MAQSIYTNFETTDIVSTTNMVTSANAWSTTSSLIAFFTSSAQLSASGDYFYEIYDEDPDASGEAQFAIAYGNVVGSGSYENFSSAGVVGLTPSRVIYSQYKNLLLPKTSTQFSIYGRSVTNFIAICFNRERYKEVLDPGNWELTLQNGEQITYLVDTQVSVNETSVSDSYHIVSGSIENGTYNTGVNMHYYGLCYPKYGILIIDADMLSASASIGITTTEHDSFSDNNMTTFYHAMVSGSSFQARSKETVSSTYYFVRIKNNMYNQSQNPTWYTGSLGQIRFEEWITDPVTYITTVGLFDENSNLLAVSKISQPIKKTKNTEALIRVKLSY